jgi:hypothetical protein
VVFALTETASCPLIVFVPAQPSLAVHDDALMTVHDSVTDEPAVTVSGFETSVTLGGGTAVGPGPGGEVGGAAVTVTPTLRLVEPPAPSHRIVNVESAVSAALSSLPDAALLPLQAPEATQAVALVDDQLRVVRAPEATLVGFAAKLTVGTGTGDGGGGVVVTVTDAD